MSKKFYTVSFNFDPKDIKTCVYCSKPLNQEGRRRHREFCGPKCRFNFNTQAGQILRGAVKRDIINDETSFIEWASNLLKRGSVTLDF